MAADAQGHETNRAGAAFISKRESDEAAAFRGSFSGYERDHFFVRGGSRFADAAYGARLDFDDDGRAVAAFDPDGDGDLDLVMLSLQRLRLLENRGPAGGFVRLRLRATKSEPLALGATVKLTAGGRTRRERGRLTAGVHTQVSPEVHFGVGDARAAPFSASRASARGPATTSSRARRSPPSGRSAPGPRRAAPGPRRATRSTRGSATSRAPRSRSVRAGR